MKKFLYFITVLSILTACSEAFEYSPYQVNVKSSEKGQTTRNLKRIAEIDQGSFKPFKIALFGDTHTFYDDFEDIVSKLNARDDFDFAIHLGDITSSAINREFQWYSDIINRMKKPVITIIGNHEYLSNGYYVFEEMYGPTNFTFVYNNCKFVIFDDIIWEKNVADPDFEWFDENLTNDNNYTHVIPFSHIPPWDQQFSYGNELAFNYMLHENGVEYSFHGHTHQYMDERRYESVLGNVRYITTEAANDRGYLIVTVHKDSLQIEKVNF